MGLVSKSVFKLWKEYVTNIGLTSTTTLPEPLISVLVEFNQYSGAFCGNYKYWTALRRNHKKKVIVLL